LPRVDQSITVTAPALTACTSSITGRAGDGGGGASGTAISGVTVSLLDSAGNPLLVNGNPVATTTASDGTYSFAGLLPSSYKVRFDEPDVQVLASSTVVSGASGTTTGTSTVLTAATSATSNVAATVVGTGAVVNALFVVPAAATADIPAAGAQGVAQTINVLSNDNAASGKTLTASTVRFCGVSPTQTPPSCSQTTLTTADGSYSVNTSTGVVTFTPNVSFTGTVTQPPRYQVTDSASNVVSATITPSVIARPTLIADTSSGAWNQNQTISPLTNDVAGSGATLVATSVKLCGSSDIAPNCSANSLTIAGQGSYTVVADGTITFDPVSSFAGTATPVTYSVTDSVGQKTATTITPTVLVPVAPVANPQSKLVLPTGTAAFTTITGANGLATGTQLSPSQTFLCAVAPNAQTPPNCNTTTVTTADGTWVLNQTTGVVTYQPNAGTSTGTKTAVMYQVTDPVGQSASAALTPVIPPAPTANPDTSTGRQAVAQLISLLGNDQPGLPSSPIDVGSVKFCVGNQVAPNCGATSLTVSGEGTYEINSLGIVTFRPLASFLGTATTITYQISDSLGQSATSTLTVTVIPPPVAVATDEVESDTNNTVASPVPIAIRDLGFGAYGKSIVFEPWANDSGGNKPAGTTQQDPQVVPTSIRLCAVGQSAPNCAATTITTPDGSYTLETSTGKVTFTPVAGFTGTATAPITYQISNNWSGPSGAATTTAILIPIIGAPGDPLAKNDDTTTKPETPVTLKPIANDTAGSSALNPTTLRLCQETDIAPNCTHLSVTNRHGTYVVNPTTGAVTFTPAKGFTGLATIPYVVSAMNAQTAHAHLTITVGEQAANQSPAGDLPQTGSNTTKLFALMALLIAIGFIALIKAKKYDLTTKQIADAAQHARR
jgi:LPXTG-motif cell wall-anchored protein